MIYKHYFKNKEIIVCEETTGEFSMIVWNNENYPKYFCPCCHKKIKKEDLK